MAAHSSTPTSPTNAAFVCASPDDYVLAAQIYGESWRARKHSLDPWHHLTMMSFHNLTVARTRFADIAEVEAECETMLREMIAADMRSSAHFMCVLCHTAACLYLSEQEAAAEAIFCWITERPSRLEGTPAKDCYETLNLVRSSGQNYLVLRDSEDDVPGLRRITTYTAGPDTISELSESVIEPLQSAVGHEIRPPASMTLIRSKKLWSTSKLRQWTTSQIRDRLLVSRESGTASQQSTRSAGKARELEYPVGFSDVRKVGQSSSREPPVLDPKPGGGHESLTRGSTADEMLEPKDSLTKLEIVNELLGQSSSQRHSCTSDETARSSQISDQHSVRLLKVQMRSGKQQKLVMDSEALLDSASDKNCISLSLCELIGAKMRSPDQQEITGADGGKIQVCGHISAYITWHSQSSGTRTVKFPFEVIEDLISDVIICNKYVNKYMMKGSTPILAAIHLTKRTKAQRIQHEQRTREIIAERQTPNSTVSWQDVVQRSAHLENNLVADSPITDDSVSNNVDSDTTTTSRSSSLTSESQAGSIQNGVPVKSKLGSFSLPSNTDNVATKNDSLSTADPDCQSTGQICTSTPSNPPQST